MSEEGGLEAGGLEAGGLGAGGGLGNQDPGVGDSDGEEEGVGHLFQVPPAPVLNPACYFPY